MKFSKHRIRFCTYVFDKNKQRKIDASIEKLAFLNKKLLKQKTPPMKEILDELESLIEKLSKGEQQIVLQEDALKRLQSYISLEKDEKICTNELTKFLINFKTLDKNKSSTYIKNYVLQSNSFYSLSSEDLMRKNIVIGVLNKNNRKIEQESKEFLIYTSRHGLANYVLDPINIFFVLAKCCQSKNGHCQKILNPKLKELYVDDWNEFKSDKIRDFLQGVVDYFSNEMKSYLNEKLANKETNYLSWLKNENKNNQYKYLDARKEAIKERKKSIRFSLPDIVLDYTNVILDIGAEDLVIFSHRILCDQTFMDMDAECRNESCFFNKIVDKKDSSK